jgi:hypothetical protein
MGVFDDAIREHLELRRRQGASEEELQKKEDEAFGRASLGASATGPEPAAPTTAAETIPPELPEPPEPPDPGPDPDDEPLAPAAEAEPSPEPPLATPEELEITDERSLAETDIEPDEVLPEESLEPERDNGSMIDDVLEETPDFLDDEPADQDQLWFERKPPKDFDFDS